MSQQIVSTWDGVANTNSWVHDGDVERSAVDIVELASSVAGYSAGAQAAADAASGYADTASAAVASIGTAATDAVAAVQDEGAAQTSALVDAGGVQSALIGSAGAAQIADIVTSGGVVTSSIADAGDAEIADIVSAGGAQVALVSAAGTSATGDLAAVTAAQSAALVSAGGYQTGLVASAGTATIALVQAEGATQTAAISASVASQVNIATSAAIVATSAATVASSTVSALTSAGSAQIALVNSAGAAQSALVVSTGATQSAAVVSAGGAQITAVNSAGAVQSAAVVSAGAAQITSIGSAGAAQIAAVTSTGGVQVELVQSAGTEQIALVQSAGAAEVQAIEDAGEVYQAQIDDNSQRIENINEYAEGQLFTYETDSTEAYVKSVPAGVVQNAEVQSIAGKTVAWNQLVGPVSFSFTHGENGVTVTWDGDKVKYNGTTTSVSWLYVSPPVDPLPGDGHKYLAMIDNLPSLGLRFGILSGTDFVYGTDDTPYYFFTNSWNIRAVNIRVPSGVALDFSAHISLIDLTLLYGAGNEPTTIEQFRAEFPAAYYAYNAGTLLSAGVTDVKSVDADNNTLATLSIPASVQALPGYGWSAGSAKNVLDLAGRKFTQNVGSVDLGSLTWNYVSATGNLFADMPSDVKPRQAGGIGAITSALLVVNGVSIDDFNTMNKVCIVCDNVFSSTRNVVYVRDTTYTSAASFKTAMSGVMLYYELASPVVTVIDPVDTMLAVEDGGTLTFQNSNGAGYRIPVASSVRYQEAVDLAGRVADAEDAIAQNTEDIATNTADIAANAASITALDTKTDITNKNVDNVLALLNGALSAEQIDSAEAYTKTVPAKAQPWAAVQSVGGKTVVWNQLADYSENEVITTKALPVGTPIVSGHKYLYCVQFTADSTNLFVSIFTRINGTNTAIASIWSNGGLNRKSIFTSSYDAVSNGSTNSEGSAWIYVNGATETAYPTRCLIWDLTLMFGAGNEPATADAFDAMFPASYYAYDAGTLKSAGVTGAVSVGKNILPPSSNASATSNGVTFTNNGDGTYTLSGTATVNTAAFTITTNSQFFVEPGIYTISAVFDGTFPAVTNIVLSGGSQGSGVPYTSISYTSQSNQFTATGRGYLSYIQMQVAAGNSVSGTIKVQIERGSTATAYTPYRAPVTLPIPAAVQSLPGYGWSAGTAYNYVDWTRKVYVQNVGSVDLGTLVWTKGNPNNAGTGTIFYALSSAPGNEALQAMKANVGANVVCDDGFSLYENPNAAWELFAVRQFAVTNGKTVVVCTTDTTVSGVTASLSGVQLQFELATPVETNISDLLSDDNLIGVEPGGTISFPSQLGDDYRIPVPSTEEYTIDLAPDAPSTDGTYTLQCTVADGVATYSWISA